MFFIGWFGPRGLASIVFALIALEDLRGVPGPIDQVVAAIGLTVLLSVGFHGLNSIGAYRLEAETASRTPVLIAGIALTVVVPLVFAVQTLRTEPLTFVAMIAIVGLAIILDVIWSRIRARHTAAAC